jgi:hypothetical protein
VTPERTSALVLHWVRLYTRDLPTEVAERRAGEIDADLHDHIAHERAIGTGDGRIAVSVLSRMVRGIGADALWRSEHIKATSERSVTRGGPAMSHKIAYRIGVGLALAAALLLGWGVLAMGVIGAEGDPFDLLYFGVLAIGIVGAVVARLRPHGMVRALVAMALAQAVVAAIALLMGKHQVPVSSVAEIVGLNAFFVALFIGAAWLFSRAAGRQPAAG